MCADVYETVYERIKGVLDDGYEILARSRDVRGVSVRVGEMKANPTMYAPGEFDESERYHDDTLWGCLRAVSYNGGSDVSTDSCLDEWWLHNQVVGEKHIMYLRENDEAVIDGSGKGVNRYIVSLHSEPLTEESIGLPGGELIYRREAESVRCCLTG